MKTRKEKPVYLATKYIPLGTGFFLNVCFVCFNQLSQTHYMRPEGPWQRLRRCLKADDSYYTYIIFSNFPIPDWRHLQQPTSYHAVLVGQPYLLPPKSTKEKDKRKKNKGERRRKEHCRAALAHKFPGPRPPGVPRLGRSSNHWEPTPLSRCGSMGPFLCPGECTATSSLQGHDRRGEVDPKKRYKSPWGDLATSTL